MNLTAWLKTRAQAERPAGIPGGPSFAYVAGWSLLMLVVVEAITGAALAAFYAPSSTDAWASVAYVQDQMPAGWLVRGLHFHAASAIVIVSGLHLVQTAIWGAYKKPRELVWWLGIVLMLLVLGFAVSGYVLRWDQAGYWANRVEVGIAASAPGGSHIRALALGGNEYGNLTLTRFYALHVIVLPALFAVVTGGHLWLARRHGATPRWGRDGLAPIARWPAQTIRNVIAMAVVFAILLGYTVSQHGTDLAAPADPSSAYDARPLWYFRWLFELRHLAGSYERFAALVAPVVVGGFLVGLPFLDRSPDRAPKKRLLHIGAVIGLFGLIGLLTVGSVLGDSSDDALAKRQEQATMLASRARALAVQNGVPVTGAQDVFATVPMYRARTLYALRCKSCHDAKSDERKGPIIGPGHGNRAWFKGFIKAPSSDPYWGHTKLSKTDDAMKPAELPDPDLDALAEMLYGQSRATDVDPAKRDAGKKIFEKACTDCHTLDEGVAGGSGPGLGELGTRDYFTSYISNPKRAIHLGGKSEMPRFDTELSIVDRDAIAGYLVWLRTATQQDLDKLGPL
jgi:ubiquinol-cytochrome c reductase cytochrome b subunit